MDHGDTHQPAEPSASRPTQHSSTEPAHSHLQQDRHHGFERRCKMVYLAHHPQPRVKSSPLSEAASSEYGSGGTPAAQTHLLLPEYGGSKMICRHRSGPQEVSWGLHVLWTQALLTGAPARLRDGGVTGMSAQDCRSPALKLPLQMGPQQGQLCQQEKGNRSLPTFFPSALPTLNKHYFCRPCVQVSRI